MVTLHNKYEVYRLAICYNEFSRFQIVFDAIYIYIIDFDLESHW